MTNAPRDHQFRVPNFGVSFFFVALALMSGFVGICVACASGRRNGWRRCLSGSGFRL